MSDTLSVESVVKSVTVACPVERAFQVFTEEIGSWWPTETHALHPGEVREVVWEGHEGGTVYEVSTGGEQSRWATVLARDPPHRLVIAWQVNPDHLGLEVEVVFNSIADGTRVDLEHRGFEKLVDGAELRASYDPGWGHVLARLVAHAG